MNFTKIDHKYRPIPFWSWNEKLDVKETKRQVYEMHKAGIGGFFMHARGGLETEYMSEEWFSNVEAAIEAAEECNMSAWAYDENGWPSGFGNGIVNGWGVEYQQKYLRISNTEPKTNLICKSGEHWFHYEVNPFYADTLNRDAVALFIKSSYEPYYERFKNRIAGFFTDEPQISRNGIPWSFVFESEYKKRHNENLLEHLDELFFEVNDYQQTRIRFWKMVTDLFSNHYMKQIYDWCTKHGYQLTGHLAEEETLLSQLTVNGACMPHYEYFHIPGIDWLGRKIYDCLTPIQLGSAAAQLGKENAITESFALCGHNVSFPELKGIYEWQLVRGVNVLCQHLEGYSIRGIRKRDYPPAMYYQQPWWRIYGKYNDMLSRESMIFAEHKFDADVLVIHPQTTAWTMFDNQENKGIEELNFRLINILKELDKKHILYHLGDETIIERHGNIKDGKFIVGNQKYTYVITSCCDVLLDHTQNLIDEFVASGGMIVKTSDIPANMVTDNENITYTKRGNLHFFVNTNDKKEFAKINVRGRAVDLMTGDFVKIGELYEFEPWGSLIISEEETEPEQGNHSIKEICLDGMFELSASVENCLTLDYCDYYFDGELQEKHGYVLNICERANKFDRSVKIHQDYYVEMKYVPKEIFLVCETPEKFRITVNGERIDQNTSGYFRDVSFKKIEISKYLKIGNNTISFECDFEQSNEFYQNMKKAYQFESEKNKLCYDMEIEAVYLVGDFSVKCIGEWEKLDRNANRFNGEFVIDEPVKEVLLKNIEKQGFPFFCGELLLQGEIDIPDENSHIVFDFKGINSVEVRINGIQKSLFGSGKMILKDFNTFGKTKIELKLFNNLRNLLGPHHSALGEITHVTPADFYKESCVWNMTPNDKWNDGYCFVETGITG